VDESDHLTLVNAWDEEVVSQEEGGERRRGEEGGVVVQAGVTRRQFNSGRPGSLYSIR
jgi:hypothetical protein